MLMSAPVGICALPQQVPEKEYISSSILMKNLLCDGSMPLPAGVHERGHPCPVQQLDRDALHLQEVLQPLHVAVVHGLKDRMVVTHNIFLFDRLCSTAGLRNLNHPESLRLCVYLKGVRC